MLQSLCLVNAGLGQRAMLLSLYGFWAGHVAAITGSNAPQQNAYDVVLFRNCAAIPFMNDFASTLDQLLDTPSI